MPTQTKAELEELGQGWLAPIHRAADNLAFSEARKPRSPIPKEGTRQEGAESLRLTNEEVSEPLANS